MANGHIPQWILVDGGMQQNPEWLAQQLKQKHGGGYGGMYPGVKSSGPSLMEEQDNRWISKGKDSSTLGAKDYSADLQNIVTSLKTPEQKKQEQVQTGVAELTPEVEQQTPEAKSYSERGMPIQKPGQKRPPNNKPAESEIDYSGLSEAGKMVPQTGSDASGAFSGMLQGAGTGAAVSGGNPYAVAAGAIVGLFSGVMGARSQRKEAEKIDKENKRIEAKQDKIRKEEKEEARKQRIYDRKQSADTAAFSNLQQAISSSLNRKNSANISYGSTRRRSR